MARFGNRVVLALLGGPLHAVLSGAVMGVTYQGRRSGQPVRLPVQYATDGDRIVVGVAQPEAKQWWRNFAEAHDAELLVQGRRRRVRGLAVRDPAPTSGPAAAYRARYPKVALPTVLVVFEPVRPGAASDAP